MLTEHILTLTKKIKTNLTFIRQEIAIKRTVFSKEILLSFLLYLRKTWSFFFDKTDKSNGSPDSS